MTRRLPAALVFGLLLALLAAAVVLATTQGEVTIPPSALARILLNRTGLFHLPHAWSHQDEVILLTLRLPRVLAAAAVGAALAGAGTLLQGLLRNPLADPYVVGTSGGASLGAVLGLALGTRFSAWGFGLVPLMAFLGALGAMLLVVQLGGIGGRLPVVTVLLAGFAVSTLLGYSVPLLMALNQDLQTQMPQIYARLLGGVDLASWFQLEVIWALVLAGLIAASGFGRTLNAFSLGEDGAARLGIAVERDKRVILMLSSLLTAAAVSISGLIGFVGLIVPHVTRLLRGPDHRFLIPGSALAGATFLVLADLLARTLLPLLHRTGELPVGVVTAFLGGPFFLWLLRRSRKEYQW